MATHGSPSQNAAPVTAAAADRRPVRDRLLAAAEELFYEDGLSAVGIDKVIARAGVAKASLYNVFGSKEELIRAYLTARHERRQARMAERLQRYATPREKIMAAFDVMGETVSAPAFRGCAFVRASAETSSSAAAKSVCDMSRGWLHGLFRDLVKELGVAQPELVARQLVLAYDGAVVSAQMDGDPDVANTARAMAALVLAHAAKA